MPKWMRWILFWPQAITIYPFGIFIKKKRFNDVETRNHEAYHWLQEKEMLVVFFSTWYFLEWVIKIFIYWGGAYMAISFEREAYANDLAMPVNRKHFAWVKYIFKT
jgi:hypothetical protein